MYIYSYLKPKSGFPNARTPSGTTHEAVLVNPHGSVDDALEALMANSSKAAGKGKGKVKGKGKGPGQSNTPFWHGV